MILCGRAEQSPAPTGLGMQKGDRRYKGIKEEVVLMILYTKRWVRLMILCGRAEWCW